GGCLDVSLPQKALMRDPQILTRIVCKLGPIRGKQPKLSLLLKLCHCPSRYAASAFFLAALVRKIFRGPGLSTAQPALQSTTAGAKACGASCGRLWPMPPMMVRCSYLPVNSFAYVLGSACGAPLASPSSVIVGTAISGACASRLSRPSYFVSPSARPSRQR